MNVLSPMLSAFLIFFLCVWVLSVCGTYAMPMCHVHAGAHEGQKRVSHPLGLDLGSGNQTQEPRSSARTRALNC